MFKNKILQITREIQCLLIILYCTDILIRDVHFKKMFYESLYLYSSRSDLKVLR